MLLFRASSQGALMTNPRGKSNLEKYNEACMSFAKYQQDYSDIKKKETKTAEKKLLQIEKTKSLVALLNQIKDDPKFSKTCKTAMRKAFIDFHFNRRKSIDNKYTRKGKSVEEQAISIYSQVKGRYYEKNETRLYNEEYLITGEPDIFEPIDPSNPDIKKAKEVIDIKAPFDIWTFYDSIENELNKDYEWQGHDYMLLTGAERHTVAYVLVSMPYDLVLNEIRRLTFGDHEGDMPKWAQIETVSNLVYEKKTLDLYLAGLDIDPNESKESQAIYNAFVELNLEDRVFEITFERDENKFVQIKERNHACKKYIEEYLMTGKWKETIEEAEEIEN